MINRNATIRWKGYDPNDLTKGSHKRVWVNCIDCGCGRWVEFCNASDRCRSCGQLFIDPRSRALKYYINNPEVREKLRIKAIEQWSVPGAREARSEMMINYYNDNPNAGADHSEKMVQYYRDNPESRDEMSMIKKEYYKKNPEHIERISARMQGVRYEDWEGFVSNDDWRDWDNAIYINPAFTGCHRHHITATIVAHIPAELHNHIRHNLKTGANMGEINALSIQFISGWL